MRKRQQQKDYYNPYQNINNWENIFLILSNNNILISFEYLEKRKWCLSIHPNQWGWEGERHLKQANIIWVKLV